MFCQKTTKIHKQSDEIEHIVFIILRTKHHAVASDTHDRNGTTQLVLSDTDVNL